MRTPLLLALLSVACRPSVAPAPPAGPPTVEVPLGRPRLHRPDPTRPYFAARGDHWLRATFAPTVFGTPGHHLATLALDGVEVVPPRCPGGPLCTEEHAAMIEDHGSQALLVQVRETDDRVDVILAGAFYGSPECGVYGYYVVRVEAQAVRVGPPARGCFSSPEDGGLVVDVGPPLRLRPSATWAEVHLELDEASLGWAVDTRVPLGPPD